MKNNFLKTNRGFTLIELLVVISIIGLLSSVVLTSLTSTKAKVRDAQRKMEFNSLVKAMNLYYDKYGYYPANMSGTVPPYYDNFNNMAQTLVNEGFLSKVPVSPCGSTCSYGVGGYAYFNYGTASSWVGAIMITRLLTSSPSSTGVPPSCRLGWSNWCDADVNTEYCMCFFR